jgi:hypothetical protein
VSFALGRSLFCLRLISEGFVLQMFFRQEFLLPHLDFCLKGLLPQALFLFKLFLVHELNLLEYFLFHLQYFLPNAIFVLVWDYLFT